MKIIWLPVAIKNLDSIYNWHLDKSNQAATKLYNDILNAVEPLKIQPNMAEIESMLSDFSNTYRSLVIRNYKIIYFVENDSIYISAVWDCRQNPKKIHRIKGGK